MVSAVGAGLAAGLVWRTALIVPATYVGGTIVAGLFISRRESWQVRVRTPLALATMHWSWGLGFLTSPRSLPR